VEVTATYDQRFKSGVHVGAARPTQTVKVRRGKFARAYREFTFLDGSTEDFANIRGSYDSTPWAPKWEPLTAYKTVPNVMSVQLDRNFDNNGIKTGVIVIENILYKALVGAAGTFRAIARGELSPVFGFAAFGRPTSSMQQNVEWYGLLQESSQITVWQGYGDEQGKSFTGLIDDVDMVSQPDRITITARSFAGPTLTEQRVFGHVKDPRLNNPIVFADRLRADDIKKVGSGARGSSETRGHPAVNVLKKDTTYWQSIGHASPPVTEYVEIRVPKGRYEDFYVQAEYAGMEMYVSFYLTDKNLLGGAVPQIDNVDAATGWADVGNGDVPGANGGVPWLKHWGTTTADGTHHRIGHRIECGDDSILRISFRKLQFSPKSLQYHAGVRRFFAYNRHLKDEAKKKRWILIDDASDMVKMALRWAGYREWEVEKVGTRIVHNKVFHQSSFLIDLITYIKDQGDFIFYESDPSSHDESIGVPVFRRTRALNAPQRLPEVRDSDLLTGVSAKQSRVPLGWPIRARGKAVKKGERLGEDTTMRITGTYYPPWKFANSANVIRHFVHFDKNLTTQAQVDMFCVLVAARMCLQYLTGQIELPGNPSYLKANPSDWRTVELDDQVSVIDTGTGLNTRLWIANESSMFETGQQTSWKTTLQGSFLDTAYMLGVIRDFLVVQAQAIAENEDG
jgi:hypothetical protein